MTKSGEYGGGDTNSYRYSWSFGRLRTCEPSIFTRNSIFFFTKCARLCFKSDHPFFLSFFHACNRFVFFSGLQCEWYRAYPRKLCLCLLAYRLTLAFFGFGPTIGVVMDLCFVHELIPPINFYLDFKYK